MCRKGWNSSDQKGQEMVNQLMNQFFNLSLSISLQISGTILTDEYCGIYCQPPISFQIILKSEELTAI